MKWDTFLTHWQKGRPNFGNDYANLDLTKSLVLERYEHGVAFLTWSADETYCHIAGSVTGGYVCVVADYAANAAMASMHSEGNSHVTPDLRMTYFRPFKPNVYAVEARVINASKISATVEVTFVDKKGRLMGKATVVEAIRTQSEIGFSLPE